MNSANNREDRYEEGEPLASPSENATSDELRRHADHLFVDALLERVHGTETPEDRTQRVMELLERTTRRRWTLPRPPWLGSGIGIAATLMIAGAFWLFTGGLARDAHAALEFIMEKNAQEVDRQYAVMAEGGTLFPGTVESVVYVRGGDHFVIRRPTPLGDVYVGTDGDLAWWIPPVGPIFASRDADRFRHFISKKGEDVPFLSLQAVLRRFGEDYDLTLTSDAPEGAEGDWIHLRGRRLNSERVGPETIDLYADPKTGVIERLDIEGGIPLVGWRRVRLSFAGSPKLPDNWYEHSAHHESDRKVFHLEDVSLPKPAGATESSAGTSTPE
ncbi:hypothetical protein Pan216_50820 [Planctomycetes bacterium Pan216]|uniref:Uncharacterized protein n=2 Tax=Kolteria novifilia TaxID=2527975 RepID=A0A518BBD5_9BACT|nr:hypothetical protein Pan216_50820 [Planctomycetes bacterium Pan216]